MKYDLEGMIDDIVEHKATEATYYELEECYRYAKIEEFSRLQAEDIEDIINQIEELNLEDYEIEEEE